MRLIILALGTFAIGTEGFVIAGVLPGIAGDLDVTVATAGQLVTLFSLAYAIAAPVMATLTASVPRRPLLVVAMTVFTGANVAAAMAPAFAWLALARIVAAISAAAFTPTAGAVAAMTASPAQRGRALATVTGGLAVATVLGAPLGTWIGSVWDWRTTFVFVATLAGLAAAGIAATLPPTATPPPVAMRDRVGVVARPAIVTALFLTSVWIAGSHVVYTYIAPLLHETAGITERELSGLFFVLGVFSVAGTVAGGLGADRFGVTAISVPSLIVCGGSLLLLPLVSTPLRAAIFMAVWGFTGWAFVAPQQHRLVSLAPATPAVILSFNSAALYFGIASGAAIGGVLIDRVPLAAQAAVAFAFHIAALALVLRLRRSARRPRYP